MEKQSIITLGEVMAKAAESLKKGEHRSFYDAVNHAFWTSFGYYEQSPVMQDVYCMLCDMGYTPIAQ